MHRQTLLNSGESPFGCLTHRASECIVLRHVDEVPLVEESCRLVARGEWLGHHMLLGSYVDIVHWGELAAAFGGLWLFKKSWISCFLLSAS